MIQKQEVERIAKLARLELKNKAKLAKELQSILKYVELLNELDLKGIEPTSNSIKRNNVMREDKPEKGVDLLDQAPATQDKLVKVKGIL